MTNSGALEPGPVEPFGGGPFGASDGPSPSIGANWFGAVGPLGSSRGAEDAIGAEGRFDEGARSTGAVAGTFRNGARGLRGEIWMGRNA
jgi:hypothetical protein